MHDQQYWINLLAQEETCVGPVYDIEDMFSDPHIAERDMFQEMQHPVAGVIQQIGFPIKFSETPGEITAHAPALGEHTEAILTQLGYDQTELEQLRAAGVIGQMAQVEW